MPGFAELLLAVLVTLQVPTAVLVYLDAKRLNLRNPFAYWYGILVPAAGLVVVPVYLSRRDELPREPEDVESEPTEP